MSRAEELFEGGEHADAHAANRVALTTAGVVRHHIQQVWKLDPFRKSLFSLYSSNLENPINFKHLPFNFFSISAVLFQLS